MGIFRRKHCCTTGKMTALTPALILVVLMCVTASSEGKRVVVVPMPYTSHTRYHTNVARELVKLGHSVWMLVPDYLMVRKVLDTSGFTVIEYRSGLGNVEEIGMATLRDCYFQGIADDFLGLINLMRDWCDDLLRNDTLFQLMKSVKPDMFIFDNISLVHMLTVMSYKLEVPFSFMGSAFSPFKQRVPFSTAVSPNILCLYSDHMSFFERVINTLLSLLPLVSNLIAYPDAVSRYAPEMPYLPLDMLIARAEIWLVEQDHIMFYPTASLPNVRFIGGTATGPAKPLSGKFQSFADKAREGLIVMTFGSYVLDLPKELSTKIFNALLQVPMKSVVRSNETSPDADKIMTSTWIPQNDLLGHANTQLFVSHCGKNGQYEALFHAVPVLCMPMFGDQPHNAYRSKVKGFGEVLDLKSCTVQELKSTILKIANEPRYRQAIGKASHLFKELFGVPKERAAWWLDHVMQYGGSHLRFAGQDIPLYQLLMADVILFLLSVAFVVACVLYFLLRWLYRCLRKRSQKPKTD